MHACIWEYLNITGTSLIHATKGSDKNMLSTAVYVI
jgi:hypothetical protein